MPPVSAWPSLELEHLLFLAHEPGSDGEAAVNAIVAFLDVTWLEAMHPFHPGVLRRVCATLEAAAAGHAALRHQLAAVHAEHTRLEEATGTQLAEHSKARLAASTLLLRDPAMPRDWVNLVRKLWNTDVELPPAELWGRRRTPEGWESILAHERLVRRRFLILDHIYRHHFTLLLLLGSAENTSSLAVPFPVRVDIVDDGKAQARIEGLAPDKVDRTFRQSVEVAARAARSAWLAKHGGYPASIKDRVTSASLVVNADMGGTVSASAFGRAALHRHLTLEQRSATLPLALAALSRLLGRAFDDAILATGPLHHPDPRSREFDVAWRFTTPADPRDAPPALVAKKLNAARSLAVYERLLLPSDTPRDAVMPMRSPACRRGGGAAHLASALAIHPVTSPQLANAVDAWLPIPWRQAQYVRAPELRHHHLPGRREWRERRIASDQPLLEAFASARCLNIYGGGEETGHAIVHALFCARARLIAARVPMLRTLFFRCSHGSRSEGHRHFWQTFLEALHATASDMETFDAAGSWEEKARVVLGLFNDFAPRWPALDRSAPNVVVLSGLDIYRERTWGPSKHLNDPWEIWSRVIPELGPHGDRDHERHFGPLRLVVETQSEFADDSTAGRLGLVCRSAPSLAISVSPVGRPGELRSLLEGLGADLAEALVRLALFRWDFTVNGALAVLFPHRAKSACSLAGLVLRALGLSARPSRELRLDAERACDALCDRRLLVEGQGRYHIPNPLRGDLREFLTVDAVMECKPAERHLIADLHVAAARYFAPLLAPPEYPTILTSEGLLFANVVEANYHCDQARHVRPQSAARTDPEDWLQANLVRFLFPVGGRSRFLMERNAWHEARQDQEAWLAGLQVDAVHPRWLMDLAETYAGQLENERTPSAARERWLAEACKLFEVALEAFQHPRLQLSPSETLMERAFVEARYAHLLLTERCDSLDDVVKALGYVDEILKTPGLPSLRADTFERAGDVVLWQSDDRQRAARYYDSARSREPQYVQPMLKRAALWLSESRPDEAARLLAPLSVKLWRAAVRDAERRLAHRRPSPPIDYALREYSLAALRFALEVGLIADMEAREKARSCTSGVSVSPSR